MATQVATRRIDVDTHFLPRVDWDKFRTYLPDGLTPQAKDMQVRDAMRIVDPRGVRLAVSGTQPSVFAGFNAGTPAPSRSAADGPSPHRDADERVRLLPSTGFDMQVLIPDGIFGNLYGWTPTGVNDRSLPMRTALAKVYNDAAADAQRRYPDHLVACAVVPFDDVQESAEEARRAVQELGIKAVMVPGNWLNRNFDDEALYPFWQVIDSLDAAIFVHHIPQTCFGAVADHPPRYPMVAMDRMRRLHLGTYLGFGLEYAVACAALSLGGVLDEFPNLRFCFFEAGATWMLYAMYGADRSFEIEPQCARTTTLPSALIKQHCITAVEPAEHLEQLVAAIGSENFFFGTDFPHPEYQRYQNTAAAILDRQGLSARDKANILGNNVARFLKL